MATTKATTPTPRANQRAERLERERYAAQDARLAQPKSPERIAELQRAYEMMFPDDDR